jgi:diguanylate cyclase (GGDEF)-like protein/PAS domain S-box-containing protein
MCSVALSEPEPDISSRELGLSRLEIERLCVRNLLANSAERILFKDLEGRFLMVSAGWLASAAEGRSLDELIGKTDFDVFSEAHAAEALSDEQLIIRTGEPLVAKVERETFADRAEGWVSTTKVPLREESGRIIGTYGISRDITEQVYAQETLAHQALHDAVTGLANRAAFTERLRQGLDALERQPSRVAVLFVDLDGFKEINDMRGHVFGDRLLAAVGQRLSSAVRHGDLVARFGGDEFVILCRELGGEDEERRVAERVREALLRPLLGDEAIGVTASIGVGFTVDPATKPDALLAWADAAMYTAKRSGCGRIQVYDESLREATCGRSVLLDELRDALACGELFPVYQPIIRLADGSLTGVEALARWRHPTRGVLTPDTFIPLAERHGLVSEIDAQILDQACRQLAAWEKADSAWRDRTIAVNLSGRGLQNPRLVEIVLGTLRRHRLATSRLCLEITESTLISELDGARRVISCLTEHGVRIALDDFGTGYSTLALLQQLQVDVLKIDRSFIIRMSREPRDRKIVAAVTAMAHALDMSVVGEGVETALERDALNAIGCDEAQGYLFARPCSPEQIAAMTHDSLGQQAAA